MDTTSVERRPLRSNGSLHCLLLRAVRPEQPNRPFSFREVLQIPVYFLFFFSNLRNYRYLLPFLKFARPEQPLGRVLGDPNAPPSFLV
jgi:hypothetical protein